LQSKLTEYKSKGMEDLYQDYASEADSIEIEIGNCVLFSSTLMHGNRVNLSETTRISLNFRFKALLSPYNSIGHSEKKLVISIYCSRFLQ
jgi:sporadic carbohydrate cluster 2OG-Fe(II) oxygenase